MGSKYFVTLLFFLLWNISLTAALVCYDTGNFTANSTYARNRGLLFDSLASNVTKNGGFYTTTVGQGPSKVYGLVLCRADSSSDACTTCVNTAIEELTAACPNQKEAISWGGDPPCIIRYANRSFFGTLELEPTDAGYNINNITSNMAQFDGVWDSLTERIITRASMGSSKIKFATEEAVLTSIQKIYALMLCTPDMSQKNCSYCLREAVGYYRSCCHGKQGGYVQKANCIFRWDLYPFYGSIGIGDAPAPSLLPPPPLNNSTLSTNTTRNMKENGGISPRTVVIIVVPSIMFVALVVLIGCILIYRRKAKQDVKDLNGNNSPECLQFNFERIRTATSDFSDNNKLGKGGFGTVYKGTLPDGQDIAVKRLSTNSKQGEVEFKNEVMLLARLQHRNLVRLLGFCLEGKERLLIYEFLPNSSLDHFIFDPKKRLAVTWEMRYKIIIGIARGILYLHEESRLRIIHRDLKAGNILIDKDMNAKISDFGLAKLFDMDQSQDQTSRVVGTFGYMAPEYAMHGLFSDKTDVFSFGVLVLEIISGQKNCDFRKEEEEDELLTYAWGNWNEGTISNLIDPMLKEGPRSDMLRCIHIGLLCVQEKVEKRPTMSSVVLMLSSCSLVLPAPSKPAFSMQNSMERQVASSMLSAPTSTPTPSGQSKSGSSQFSVNEASITELEPR